MDVFETMQEGYTSGSRTEKNIELMLPTLHLHSVININFTYNFVLQMTLHQ